VTHARTTTETARDTVTTPADVHAYFYVYADDPSLGDYSTALAHVAEPGGVCVDEPPRESARSGTCWRKRPSPEECTTPNGVFGAKMMISYFTHSMAIVRSNDVG